MVYDTTTMGNLQTGCFLEHRAFWHFINLIWFYLTNCLQLKFTCYAQIEPIYLPHWYLFVTNTVKTHPGGVYGEYHQASLFIAFTNHWIMTDMSLGVASILYVPLEQHWCGGINPSKLRIITLCTTNSMKWILRMWPIPWIHIIHFSKNCMFHEMQRAETFKPLDLFITLITTYVMK